MDARPISLTPLIALSFVAGVCVPLWLPALPSMSMVFLVAAVGMMLLRWPSLRIAAAALLGLAWASFSGTQALKLRIDDAQSGEDVRISGTLVGLPRNDLVPRRFELMPDADTPAVRGLLRLSWYGDIPDLQPGQRFSGTVRLRAPRGVENPGGFDFSRHALAQRLSATGYVRDGSIAEPSQLSLSSHVDRGRASIARTIDISVSDRSMAALLRALAVGDQRGLEDPEWDTLRITGTGHLIAISGMHIGLVAAFGALLFGFLYRLWPRLALYLPKLTFSAVGALLWATAYSLLAGWSLPVQRTLLMIVVVLVARMLRRNVSMMQSLALAAVLVVIWDPLAVLGAGFWLSFVGVAGLMWALPDAAKTVATSHRDLLRGFGRAQLAMSVGLLPITIAFFGQGSVVGPIANLIAVPWITLLIVPMLLVAVFVSAIVPIAGQWLLSAAAWLLQPLWQLLQMMGAWPGASWFFTEPALGAIVLAAIGALWWLLPRGVPLRWPALLLFLPLLFPRAIEIADGDARISMIDVGQGLSVLVQTRDHAVLFDAGMRSRTGFDMGEAAVVPTMHALGVRSLDRLVLSNQDADHAGGREAVLRAFPEAAVSIGIESDPAPRCQAGQSWDWDGVHFEFLHPPPYFPDKGNDSSCVLRIQAGQHSALLTGDIGEVIEARLLREQPDRLRADLVFVPHHGSRSSSSAAFVAATDARWAFNSAGQDNRFGHPHPEVKQRWLQSGARWVDTAAGGFSTLLLSRPDEVEQRRIQRARYWH